MRVNVIVEPDSVHLGEGIILLRLTEDGVCKVYEAFFDCLDWLATHRAGLVGEENKDVGVLLLWLKLIVGLAVDVYLELAVSLTVRSGLFAVFKRVSDIEVVHVRDVACYLGEGRLGLGCGRGLRQLGRVLLDCFRFCLGGRLRFGCGSFFGHG